MKPRDGTFAHNALEHGVAGLWIDGCRVETNKTQHGRHPANLILDEEAGALLDTQSGMLKGRSNKGPSLSVTTEHYVYSTPTTHECGEKYTYGGTGGASRFFYCAKASRKEKTCNGIVENKHPTVKPLALMRYLVRLTMMPTVGMVFDPFMGSGTTGIACTLEGQDFIGADNDEVSYDTAVDRIWYYD